MAVRSGTLKPDEVRPRFDRCGLEMSVATSASSGGQWFDRDQDLHRGAFPLRAG